jgi:hypothetical protein
VAQAKTPEERKRIEALPLDVASSQVTDVQFSTVGKNLEEAPPVRFDLARQVRVFEPYLHYVKLNLTGAAIQRQSLRGKPSAGERDAGSMRYWTACSLAPNHLSRK